MDYINIRLELGTDLKNYYVTIPCTTFEEVEYYLNRAELYDKYMVVAFNVQELRDDVVASGRIEPNRKHEEQGVQYKKTR